MSELRAELEERGFALIPATPELAPEEAARAPWAWAERLLGVRPRMVERQPIRAVPGGKTFASSSGPTPLHTDSQLFAGAAPDLQILACVRPAARGGESLLLDTWPLLAAIGARDPSLYDDLFQVLRRIPFFFGDVLGPTVSLRGGALTFTHSPMPAPNDALGERLARHLAGAPVIEVMPRAGWILIADNHRLLHGRRAFEGARELTRLLVWLDAPLPAPGPLRDRAAEVASRLAGSVPVAERRRLGLAEPASPAARRRLAIVLEMLRGTPPGVLAARERVPEAALYRWRDAALGAGEAALEDDR